MTDAQTNQVLTKARNNELHASHEAASINKMAALGEPDDTGKVLVACVCGVLLSVTLDAPKVAADKNILPRRSVNDQKDGS